MRGRGATQDVGLYRCPATGRPLSPGDAGLTAAGGDRVYPVRDGVPVLLQRAAAESAEERERLDRLNHLADEAGAVAALRQVYGEASAMVRYVTDPGRAKFIELLPLTPQMHLLEIGPGLGQFTPMLAERVGQVAAIEVVEGQARFVRRRCEQAGRDNVAVACGGDDCRLPYADAMFDGVVLNLVLEWCGSRSTDEAHQTAQHRLLGEVARVLRPGGFAFIATKNRYALRYLIGKGDEHAFGMPFGNALPRRLMHLLLRRRGERGPAGLLHGHGRLRRMLASAGFDRIDAYWAAPEMRYPQRYVRADAASVRAVRRAGGFEQGESRLLRLLMRHVPAGLVRQVAPGNVFLAWRGGETTGDR